LATFLDASIKAANLDSESFSSIVMQH